MIAAQLETEAAAARLRSGAEAPKAVIVREGGKPPAFYRAPLIAARTRNRLDRSASARGPWPHSLVSGPLGGRNGQEQSPDHEGSRVHRCRGVGEPNVGPRT
jgi:hypothetical protein